MVNLFPNELTIFVCHETVLQRLPTKGGVINQDPEVWNLKSITTFVHGSYFPQAAPTVWVLWRYQKQSHF